MSAELEQWRKENVSKGLVESMGDVGNGSAPVRGKVDLILMKYGGGQREMGRSRSGDLAFPDQWSIHGVKEAL